MHTKGGVLVHVEQIVAIESSIHHHSSVLETYSSKQAYGKQTYIKF